MVSTRNHPVNFPPPDASPTKSSPKRTTRASSAAIKDESPTPAPDTSLIQSRPGARSRGSVWSHTPSKFTLVWLSISLPLVIWDTGYMLGRPHTMPGGKWHSPLYTPYEIYCRVDHVYGFPGYESKDGWGPAQAWGNVMETALYLAYVGIAFVYGKEEDIAGRGAPTKKLSFGRRKIVGREATVAVVLGFSAALMTFYKTILYWLIEILSGFQSIGHNTAADLTKYWIIPNGAWIVASGYILYVCGSEILQGLENAGGLPDKKSL